MDKNGFFLPAGRFFSKILFLVIFLVLLPVFLYAGSQIAYFTVDVNDFVLSYSLLEGIQEQIDNTLCSLQDSVAVRIDTSIDSSQTGMLLDIIRAPDADIPESLELDESAAETLRGSVLVVIPAISYVKTVPNEGDEGYTANLGIHFSFLERGSEQIFETVLIEVDGEGLSEEEALLTAAAALPGKARVEFRKLDFFQDRSQILEILDKRRVVLAFGRDKGLIPGDELFILPPYSADTTGESAGIVLVEDVSDRVSYGYVICSDEAVTQNTRLEVIKRLGLDFSLYERTLFSIDEEGEEIPFSALFGIRVFPSHRFPRVRPFLGLELPVHAYIGEWPGFPVNAVAGIEAIWNIGRFQIIPSTSLGAGIIFPTAEEEEFLFSHIGTSLDVEGTWLFHPNFRLLMTLGYSQWVLISRTSLSSSGIDDYGGILVGLGIIMKV